MPVAQTTGNAAASTHTELRPSKLQLRSTRRDARRAVDSVTGCCSQLVPLKLKLRRKEDGEPAASMPLENFQTSFILALAELRILLSRCTNALVSLFFGNSAFLGTTYMYYVVFGMTII